jgi:hypothetical protein
MDFIEGETLLDRLDRDGGGPLPVNEVLGWAAQLCDVLAYLHSQNPPVIFRDIKPGNVMVTPEKVVKLIDFGIARIFKPGKASDTSYFGTAGYAPREQYGKGQTDARSDVYALGATLHHLLTGADPVDNPFCFEEIQLLNGQVPGHVADAVMKAVSDDPADRWQNIKDMKRALLTVPKPQPDPAPRPRPPVSPTPKSAVATPARPTPTPQPAPKPSRLSLGCGTWLMLVGATLFGVGQWYTRNLDYVWGFFFPPALFAFIPALFGILFGPWIGGFAGTLGSLALIFIPRIGFESSFAVALSAFALGMLPGLMVKNARNTSSVIWAGILASGMYALAIATVTSIINGFWGDFWHIVRQFLIAALPLNFLLLPLLARWLVGPMQRLRLYWQDFH